MTALPSFDEMFAAAYPGSTPFPWQRRLVSDVLANGWPDVLDLPTGSGKTSALDIALYCLAAAPERMPRRIVLVVDRRIVVDQGAERARELQRRMEAATDGPLAAVAHRLRALWQADAGEPPFAVAVMRGGMPRDNDWARRPDQPVLGVSTVDQVGSRLLFRGYGVGARSAPIHAGLLGNDTLILLDEVHLANAFAALLDKVRSRFRSASGGLPDRFAITQMSATRRTTRAARRVFELDDADRADPTLARRLGASKRAALRTVKVSGDVEHKKLEEVAKRAVHEAIALQTAGARVVAIVVNRVDTARMAARLLARHDTTDAELVTGRMRPIERDHLVHRSLLPRVGAGRTRTADERPLVVVATQCIEAGADLDFDAIVTECASLDALRQRFGRVDRRGCLGTSSSVILARADQIAEGSGDPVYGEALGATWRWLVEHAAREMVDFGISALPEVSDAAAPSLLPPVADVPVLLPAHLDAWAQTSQRPVADPDVALWLHGKARPGADVQVIWRANIDLDVPDPERAERLEELIDRLQACRPSALEAVTVPLSAVRRWLDTRSPESDAGEDAMIADVEGEVADTAQRSGRRAAVPSVQILRWLGDDSEEVWPSQLRPGDVVVLDAARGGLWRGSFDPASRDTVVDLGDLAQLRGRGTATVRLTREALAVWRLPAHMLDAIPVAPAEEPPEDLEAQVEAWLAQWPETVHKDFIGRDAEWHAARSALQSRRRRRIAVIGGHIIVTAPAELRHELDDAVTEDDDSSFRRVEVKLSAHSTHVRDFAAQYARSLGFDEAVVADLALAAWLHDVGKADPRFQCWLVGGSEIRAAGLTHPLAKSSLPPGSARERRIARVRAGYPAGYRHELLSLAMIRDHEAVLQQAHDRDLVLHLVASHHGWCRPFPPPIADPQSLDVRLQHGEHELTAITRHELARLDSGIAPRFWRLVARYGWWGLAWLEAVIRLADHRASEQEQEPGGAS